METKHQRQTASSCRRSCVLLTWLGALLCLAGRAAAADVKLIANASVKVSAVSVEEIKNVFLETRTSLSDGSRVQPVLLRAGPVHAAFIREFIGRTDSALETYYRSLVFTGRGLIPPSFATDADMAAYVARTRGAIGYVSAEANVAGVRVLEVR